MNRMNSLDLSRRNVILAGAAATGTIAMTGLASASPRHIGLGDFKKEAEIACLYHCDYGDHARFAQTLNNIGNHYGAYGSDPFALQISLVVHGGGIKFFLSDLAGTMWKEEVIPPELFERTESLSKNGLKVYLCEVTFRRNKLDPSRARQADFISFVPSGVAAVAAMQAKGFAYLKVG